MDEKTLEEYYPEVEVYSLPFRFNRSHGFLRNTPGYLVALLSILNWRTADEFLSHLVKSDMVVFNGGNLFRCESLTDLIRLIGLMYPVRVAQKELIPTLVFPQSASKINSLGQLILRRPLEKAVAIWAREERSMRYLQQVFPNITVYPSIDLAFFTGARSTKDCYTEERFFDQGCQGSRFSVRVAITIRAQRVGDLRHLGPIESGEIVDCMRQTLDDLLEADRDILLVVQARKDRDITNLVYK
ncbi:MAG: polysaccharide pyruvyl transferase family protein [Firmicutes bacterium]|nr:polysaccharide pyruvyl transferase family protein [Bacillota bacterium]